MKALAYFKYMDVIVQLLAFFVPLALPGVSGAVLVGWISFGAAQTLSCFINRLALPKDYRVKSRIGYEVFSAVFVLGCLLTWITDVHAHVYCLREVGQCIVYAGICASPGLGAWYLVITIREIKKINWL